MHQSGWTEMFDDIWISGNWKTAKKISKGWSSDIKYYIETANSKPLLLRVSDIELYDAKKKEYEIISKYSCLGFPMSRPIDFGTCNTLILMTIYRGIFGPRLPYMLPTLLFIRLNGRRSSVRKKSTGW